MKGTHSDTQSRDADLLLGFKNKVNDIFSEELAKLDQGGTRTLESVIAAALGRIDRLTVAEIEVGP